jgi:2-keto-4-pentenoate hydratase/2-oxohepta-3-ene-1,7-dioic acid hydratase in catechol pathway
VPAAAPEVGRVVYEGELAVVIGRTAHRLARDAQTQHPRRSSTLPARH